MTWTGMVTIVSNAGFVPGVTSDGMLQVHCTVTVSPGAPEKSSEACHRSLAMHGV